MQATAFTNAADREHGYELGCDGYMTREEVAEYIRRSVKKVDELVRDRELRFVKAGKAKQASVTICRRSVIEWNKRNEG